MKRLILICLSAVAMSSCGDGSSREPSEGEMMVRYQVLAKSKLEESLRDPSSAKYEDVTAHRVTTGGFIFCGKINAKNGFGGYAGFERFVASPVIAGTEAMIDGFDEVWGQLCSSSSRIQSIRF